MDKELAKYYENAFSMMSTQGWADLVEDFANLKEKVNDLSTVSEPNELYFRKGQLDILGLILQRREMCEQVYEELTNATALV